MDDDTPGCIEDLNLFQVLKTFYKLNPYLYFFLIEWQKGDNLIKFYLVFSDKLVVIYKVFFYKNLQSNFAFE